MLEILEKTDLNQISLTGTRALVILGLLMEAPRTLDEIKKTLMEHGLMENEHSDDVLRIDLNTLRTMGCEITKASAKTNYTHILTKHPFTLDITSEEIAVLKKVYKKAKENLNIALMLKYDELFKKLAGYVGASSIRDELCGISSFKNYDTSLVKNLIEDSRARNTVKLIYQNPNSEKETEKEISVIRITMQNDKIYLYGYDCKKNESVVLNVKRIKKILGRVSGSKSYDVNTKCIKFLIKDFGVSEPDKECEKIIEQRADGYLVEGHYYNEFLAMQRVLSFGSSCTVLEPEDFKQKIIQKLKDMRAVYNG